MTPPNISHLIDSRSSNLLREATTLELDGVKVAICIEYNGLTKYFVTDENFQPNWNAEADAKITIPPTQTSNGEKCKNGDSLSSDFASSSAFGSPAFSAPNSDMVRAELPLESGSFTQSNPSICVFGTPVLDSVESPERRFATPTPCSSVFVESPQLCPALSKSASPVVSPLPSYCSSVEAFVEDSNLAHSFQTSAANAVGPPRLLPSLLPLPSSNFCPPESSPSFQFPSTYLARRSAPASSTILERLLKSSYAINAINTLPTNGRPRKRRWIE
ncbi:hypothetical protein OOU_Y34scaffold01039g2 [Pyricularia oryzae Y34]|uniref:Uncharacterized protein n=1 Tax=Pyricularia oryzae (strain Y34) TaxID=1143189 RepID=A0AA97NMC6_PYRO3|nr:hypothetical protein OOU_Y34scaffold01039g2 [Pyricularia oryzae Y34]KAI6502259.1 hypothetical protein MCOR10_011837 [Pyricularia oryzae]